MPNSFQIIYLDHDFIVIDKPSGLLSVPGLVSSENCFDQVKTEFPNARVVHRLDMATSGLLMFALHYESQKALGKLFETKKIKKMYVAVVDGIVKQDSGEIDAPLICDWDNRPRQKIDWEHGKASWTLFEVITRNKKDGSTKLKLSPVTGRSHQLRLHSFHIGHPILGDQLYFKNGSEMLSSRLLLHARELKFQHPISGREIHLVSEENF